MCSIISYVYCMYTVRTNMCAVHSKMCVAHTNKVCSSHKLFLTQNLCGQLPSMKLDTMVDSVLKNRKTRKFFCWLFRPKSYQFWSWSDKVVRSIQKQVINPINFHFLFSIIFPEIKFLFPLSYIINQYLIIFNAFCPRKQTHAHTRILNIWSR
jgi:hypothetical protein